MIQPTGHGEPGRDGAAMVGAAKRVAPEQQPLRPAVALGIITLVSVLSSLLGVVAALLLLRVDSVASTGWLEDPTQGTQIAIWLVVVMLVAVAISVISIGLSVAGLILGILVVVRGDGKLRIGAAMLLATSVTGLFVSFSVEGAVGADTITDVLTILSTVFQVLEFAVAVAGLVVLLLGIREVRRMRADQPSALR